MKTAFLFAGQGAQHVGMGQDIYFAYPQAKALYDSVTMDFDLKTICFHGPAETLNDTAYTQSCMLVTSLAIAQALDSVGIKADVIAGLSLGEYSALTYAKAIDLNQAVDLVRKRGQIMANALPAGTSSMLAVLSSDLELLKTVCQEAARDTNGICDIANYNSPSQTVLSGTKDAITQAKSHLTEKGVRSIPLNVSGAFHSSLLVEASEALALELANIAFKTPSIPVFFNINGESVSDIPKALTKQIHSSVEWVKTIKNLDAEGVDTYIEIGPGNTLSKFVKAILPQARVYSIQNVKDIQALKGDLHG